MKGKMAPLIIPMTLLMGLSFSICADTQERVDNGRAAGTINPVPWISQPLLPDAVKPGVTGFTLTVNGTGFVTGSVVKWDGNVRTTTFVTGSQLKATILSSDIARAGVITVSSPRPGGGTSNSAYLEIATPVPALLMSESAYGTGSGTQAVATADLNGDGNIDLVVANLYSNSVTVFLGKGNGTFGTGVNYSTGLNPTSVRVGDLNGDGNLDLAVATAGGPTVSVLLGNGDGTFQARTEYPTGSGPLDLALGDFNHDGKLDIVTANNNSNLSGTVSVLLGNGDGTFGPHVEYRTGVGPWSVAVGDFNRDGNLDLAVANYVDGNISVLLGNGDGTFRPQVAYATGRQPISVAAGDLNRDGKLDLAVANFADNTVSVLRGNGNGSFQTHVDYLAGRVPSSVVMADFNSDGNVDLAVANAVDQTVSVLLGNGDGTFQGPVNYLAGNDPQALGVGDFNRDGRPDLAVANYSFSGPATVSVLLAQGTPVALSINGLTFATQLLGTVSGEQSIAVTNRGNSTVKIGSIRLTGINPQDFPQNNNCGTTLAAGASCTINFVFSPTQIGTRTASLEINDNAAGSPQTISLRGTGTSVELDPNSLSFGCFRVCLPVLGCHCDCTPPKTTTLTNVGSTSVSISSVRVSGPFTEGNDCPKNLGGKQSCTLSVGWSRSSGEGEILVNDNGGGSPQTVSLSGFSQCSP